MKSVLITGCSDDGIGSGLALVFQRKGYRVFATARNPDKMSQLKDTPNIDLLTLDVTDNAQIQAAVEVVSAATGGTLDILVNNAGAARYMPVLDEDLEACRRLFETNVWGSLAVTQAFSGLVIRAKGVVGCVSSLAAHSHTPFLGVYAASKKSLEVISDTLRVELAPFGVKVLTIVTGPVKTNANSAAHFGDLTLPEDSRYKAIESIVAARAQGDDGATRQPLMKYAETVAKRLTAGQSGKAWAGGMVGVMWMIEKIFPVWLADKVYSIGAGLEKLGENKKE